MSFYISNHKIIKKNYNDSIRPNVIRSHINHNVRQRIYNKNPAECFPLYTTKNPYYNNLGLYIRNPNCWINGVSNISCISPAHLGNGGANFRRGTLITKKHLLFAQHYTPGIFTGGTPFIFVDENNNVVRRNLIQMYRYADYADAVGSTKIRADIAIGLLDSEVPSNIKPAKVLPKNYKNYINIANTLAAALDQEDKVLVKTSTYFDGDKGYEIFQGVIYFNNIGPASVFLEPFSDWTIYPTYTEDVIAGDSGNPIFYIINNEIVILTTWFTPWAGPFLPYYFDEVNEMIETLSPAQGYSLTPIDIDSVYKNIASVRISKKN